VIRVRSENAAAIRLLKRARASPGQLAVIEVLSAAREPIDAIHLFKKVITSHPAARLGMVYSFLRQLRSVGLLDKRDGHEHQRRSVFSLNTAARETIARITAATR
jgi:Fe2+ or Zn2+ uptake regulation protein